MLGDPVDRRCLLAGLPTDPDTLAALVDGREIGSFAAALVRRSLQK